MSAPCCWVQHRGVSLASRWSWLCFPLYYFGWSPGWDAWLGLGFLREEWVALFWGYVRSPGFGEVMIWQAGISGGMLWGLVIQIWSQLPFMPRLSLVLVILVLAYLRRHWFVLGFYRSHVVAYSCPCRPVRRC